MSLPEVSVIIPTYNGSRFIADALWSVFAQTYLPCEIIVVDDCSTDDTLQVVERLQVKSPVPLRIIPMDRNFGGPAKPTNVGIKAAAGELIAVLDHDDVFADDKLAVQASFLAEVPEIVCVGGVAGEWKNGVGLPGSGSFAPAVLDGADVTPQGWVYRTEVTGRILRRGMFLVGFPSLMFRRSAWEQVGGIDERWKIVGDFDFLCRLVSTGGLGLQSSTVYYRRNHADNLSGRRVEMYLEDARVRDRLLSQPPLKDDRELHRAMAEHCLWVAYWFREDAQYGPAWTMLRWARRFGASWRTVTWQCSLLVAHFFLYNTGLRKRVASGVTEAPWLLQESRLREELIQGKCCG